MDVFTDAELRIKFLQARDAWFQSVLNSIPVDDPYHHISKTVEASRVHLFDIVTQYRAIFTDDDLLLSSPAADDRPNDSLLFHGWVVQKVSQFLATLERDLRLGVGGRLDSVLGQCMYFGLSFSRVGADFRGLLAPIFERAALASFTRAINEANERFEDQMQSYTLIGTGTSTTSSLFTLTSPQATVPMILVEFQPLAIYCNAVLSAFNDLRLCLPLSLASDVAGLVEESLTVVVSCIVTLHRVDQGTFTTAEQDHFTRMCRAFAAELLPHLNTCLQSLFPPSQLATLLGLPVSELNKMGKIGQVDVDKIIEPLQQIVPALLEVSFVVDDSVPATHLDRATVATHLETDPTSAAASHLRTAETLPTTGEMHLATTATHPVTEEKTLTATTATLSATAETVSATAETLSAPGDVDYGETASLTDSTPDMDHASGVTMESVGELKSTLDPVETVGSEPRVTECTSVSDLTPESHVNPAEEAVTSKGMPD